MYGYGAQMTGYGEEWSMPCHGYSDDQEYAGWDWQQSHEEAEAEGDGAEEAEEVESDELRCRSGRNCMFLAVGSCKYYHPPADHECRNGPACAFFAKGTCKYYHPEMSLAELESRMVLSPTKQTPTKSEKKAWNVLVVNTPESETTRSGPSAALEFDPYTQPTGVSTSLLLQFESASKQEPLPGQIPCAKAATADSVVVRKPKAKASDVEKDVVVVSVTSPASRRAASEVTTPVSKTTAGEPRSRTPRASLLRSPKSHEDTQRPPMSKANEACARTPRASQEPPTGEASEACSTPKSRHVFMAEPRSRTPRGTKFSEELGQTPKINMSPASLFQSPQSKKSHKSPSSNTPKFEKENAAPVNSPGGASTPCTPEIVESSPNSHVKTHGTPPREGSEQGAQGVKGRGVARHSSLSGGAAGSAGLGKSQ